MGKFEDLSGQRFGRLVVLGKGEHHISKSGKKTIRWRCLCDCGNYTLVDPTELKRGNVKSCGCLSNDALAKRQEMHGLRNTRLYSIWCAMKRRCNNPNAYAYCDYGGRGITVCSEWSKSFTNFYNWAINNGYKDNLTIDRTNNELGYSPDNCKWVDMKAQGRNKRNNQYFEYNGEKLTMPQWSEKLGVNCATLRSRIYAGWSVERALTTP